MRSAEKHQIVRSRNARLNQARAQAVQIENLLRPDRRPDDAEGWNRLFAELRDLANDVSQCAHEASAYNNAFKNLADAAP